MSNRNDRRPVPAPVPNHRAEEDAFHKEQAEIRNSVGLWAGQMGMQVPFGDKIAEPRTDEAVAHLRSLPLHLATKQAREWTGRDDIHTLDEAIAAVTDALKQD